MRSKPVVINRRGRKTPGRGFSSGELKKAESSLVEALRLHISVDPNRKTTHEDNVEMLKTLLKEKKTSVEPKKEKGKSKN